MKKIRLVIMLLAISAYAYSQETKTIYTKDPFSGINSIGYFGGPFVSATQINNDWGLMIGGKGGAIINNSLAFGATGMGIISNTTSNCGNYSDIMDAPLQIGMRGVGIIVEYVFNYENLAHFSIPLNIMGGVIDVKDKNLGVKIESSAIFIIEPGLNLELNISRYFISSVNISYRQIIGSSLKNFDDKVISGINIGLIFKFGYY